MDIDWEVVRKGIQLLFGVQLVILAFAKLVYGTKKQYPLALFCLITSMWFFRKFFWGVWQEYDLLIVLIGGTKELFIGPLLFAHLRVMRERLDCAFLLRHFSIPTLFYLQYLVHRIGFNEHYVATKYDTNLVFFALLTIILITYTVLCMREFKLYLTPILVPKARKKHYLFIILTLTWYLPSPYFSALYVLTREPPPDIIWEMYMAAGYFQIYFFEYYFYGISIFLLLYGLTETRYFKNLFLAKDMMQKAQAPDRQFELATLIDQHFLQEKIFLKPDFTAEVAAKALGCSKRELTEYLKEKENCGFAEFVNRLKVNEFKSLIALEENQLYDMVSVAEKAGFKSKATFNRVFKLVEGVTPKEYRQSLTEKGNQGTE